MNDLWCCLSLFRNQNATWMLAASSHRPGAQGQAIKYSEGLPSSYSDLTAAVFSPMNAVSQGIDRAGRAAKANLNE
jgi:hypothetical protein